MPFKTATNRGLVKTIVLIVIALLIVSYFGLNLRGLINAPTTQDNFSYVWNGASSVWNEYLSKPATYLWNEIFVNLIWKPALHNLENGNVLGTSTQP